MFKPPKAEDVAAGCEGGAPKSDDAPPKSEEVPCEAGGLGVAANRPELGAVVAAPNKPVEEGAVVVVLLPKENAGALVFGGAPRLNRPPLAGAGAPVLSPPNSEG